MTHYSALSVFGISEEEGAGLMASGSMTHGLRDQMCVLLIKKKNHLAGTVVIVQLFFAAML